MVKSFHTVLNPAPCHCNRDRRVLKIRKFGFLEHASDSSRSFFETALTQQCLEQGGELSPYQHQGGSFGIVVGGACKVYRYVDDQRFVTFDLLAAGDIFVYGLEKRGGIDLYTYPDQIASLTTSCILTMSRERFEKLLMQDSALTFAVCSALSTRLARTHERQVQCLSLEAEQRIAFLLTHLLEKTGSNPATPGLIPFNLSRKDLASMAGLTLETTSRILSEFERQGIISTGRAWVQVADRAAVAGLVKTERL